MMKTNNDCAGTVCNSELFSFPPVKKRQVQASFDGGEVTSDAGLLALRQVDRKLGLTRKLARVLPDSWPECCPIPAIPTALSIRS